MQNLVIGTKIFKRIKRKYESQKNTSEMNNSRDHLNSRRTMAKDRINELNELHLLETCRLNHINKR